MDNSAITCDEITDAEATPYGEETKIILTNFNEKKQPLKHKIYIFYLYFYELV